MPSPSSRSLLHTLNSSRLVELGRALDISLGRRNKDAQVETLLSSHRASARDWLGYFQRDELKQACRAHGLEDVGRARSTLIDRLLPDQPAEAEQVAQDYLRTQQQTGRIPNVGDVIRVRHRQYLVDQIHAFSNRPHDATRLSLLGLDDDNLGHALEVFWELELGAHVLQAGTTDLGALSSFDRPEVMGAYLHALRWNAMTATDPSLFQAPFHAGIEVFPYQMVPLRRALHAPRATLFLADDVGLGKTVEAGLVVQELTLRQQLNYTVIAAPAAVCKQWQEEMANRFGLHFEIYDRGFVERRRRTYGFGRLPWSTYNRFIISHHMLRRPEHLSGLRQALGQQNHAKSLLVLDEAHAAAPATASAYAVDSYFTAVVREIAPSFAHRIFLSATPHNGHSNSFSALLEILDHQRFTRGVKVTGRDQLDAVMVRRLKQDLVRVGSKMRFPKREVIQLSLAHADGQWLLAQQGQDAVRLGDGGTEELELAELLARYDEIARPQGNGRGALVFINLQKRLLSSTEAFHRTLKLHAKGAEAMRVEDLPSVDEDVLAANELADADHTEEPSDEAVEQHEVFAQALTPVDAKGEAKALLEKMLKISDRRRDQPDAKILAVLNFIRQTMCPAAGLSERGKAKRTWSDRRLIIFTEYTDTKRYILQQLESALADTDRGAERVAQFHGGMSDAQRQDVQHDFNDPADKSSVRILVATDAAREGLNLQERCADLIHFDIPWNPSRMEQRNGRVDRVGQKEAVVRCHYFSYTQRPADTVLATLVRKTQTVQRELGSMSALLEQQLSDAFAHGIGKATAARLEAAAVPKAAQVTASEELAHADQEDNVLRDQLDEAKQLLQEGKARINLTPEMLAQVVDMGLRLAGYKGGLSARKRSRGKAGPVVYDLPSNHGRGWVRTLDTLRRPRRRDQDFDSWRNQPPLPVSFDPEARSAGEEEVAQLHLAHPYVKKVLAHFRAQGFSAHDMSRITLVATDQVDRPHVVLVGRLSLFGRGAARLHDDLIYVAAPWYQTGQSQDLRPLKAEAAKDLVRCLHLALAKSSTTKDAPSVPEAVKKRVLSTGQGDLLALGQALQDGADAALREAETALRRRGEAEADELRRLLERQRETLETKIAEAEQRPMIFSDQQRREKMQFEADRKFWHDRQQKVEKELSSEPAALQDLYEPKLRRVQPVALVYLWPEGRT